MGKVTKVKNCRKDYVCGRCGKKIEKGQPYFRGDLNFAPPVVRCCECGLEPWEVTTSDYILNVGEIVNRWHQHYSVDESGRDSMVTDLEEIRDELQDRLDNMPEGLQQGDSGQILESRIESLDAAISDLEMIDFDEEFDDGLDEEDHVEQWREEIDSALCNIEL